jgi:hypothetical protein
VALRKILSLNGDLPIRFNHHANATNCIWGEHPIAPTLFIRLVPLELEQFFRANASNNLSRVENNHQQHPDQLTAAGNSIFPPDASLKRVTQSI